MATGSPFRSAHRSQALAAALAITLGTFAAPSMAALWSEVGDAGQTLASAQITGGSGALTTIQGAIQNDADVDLYCIRITDATQFSASLLCTTFSQNDLWLFRSNGTGVEGNDACQFSFVSLTSSFVSVAGTYYLAISADGADAFGSAGNLWLSPAVTGPRAPDGPGAATPLINWTGASHAFNTTYSVNLSGCAFCDAPVGAEPGTWGRMKSLYR